MKGNRNIIGLLNYFLFVDGFIEILEYAEKGELTKYIIPNDTFINEKIAFKIFYKIYSAVYTLHKANIVHRDLKLDNILINIDGDIKICDFGLSRILSIQELQKFNNIQSKNQIILRSSFVGSGQYLPPEIIESLEGPLFSVDVWCLGVILYNLLFKKMPFDVKVIQIFKLINFLRNSPWMN